MLPSTVTQRATLFGREAPTPEARNHPASGTPFLPCIKAAHFNEDLLICYRIRNGRGRKEVGIIGQASWLSSVINIVNTSKEIALHIHEGLASELMWCIVLGAGLLAMPLALSRMGMLLGIIVILWSGLTAGFGLYLQTRCARYLERGSASFFALSQITYPNAAVIFDAAIAIKCFGVGVSYLIIIGDLMPGVVQGFSGNAGGVSFLLDRHFWVTGFM